MTPETEPTKTVTRGQEALIGLRPSKLNIQTHS